jgi:hypothetical protein
MADELHSLFGVVEQHLAKPWWRRLFVRDLVRAHLRVSVAEAEAAHAADAAWRKVHG